MSDAITPTFDKERLIAVAEELGLKVTFNSDTPGVFNTTTGEHKTFDEIFEGFFDDFEPILEVGVKSFKKGERVHHETMGYGTVSVDSYHTIHSSTWTCVTYDDYLGQKFALCGETSQLTLAEPLNKLRKYEVE